jgi:ferric-dicitrate binding protein FerR (iron transport regulator)
VSFANAYVTLESNAAMIMDHDRANPTAVLEDGVAKFAVGQRTTPLTVLAGDMTARTVNATFTVTRHGELANVAVTTGTVEIHFRGHDVKLTTNQSWSSERPSGVATP